jgi:hypothetical protein
MKKLLLVVALATCAQVHAQIITIKAARGHKVGDTVSIRGIVSCDAQIATNQRFIQDGTGGISLYGAAASALSLGDSVEFRGAISNYKGLLEINPNASYTAKTFTTGNKRHAPKITTIYKGGGWDTATQGLLCRVNNVQFTKSTGSTLSIKSGSGTNYYVTNGSDSAAVRIVASSNFAGMNTPSGKIGLIGVMSVYCSAGGSCPSASYQFIPLDTTTDLLRSTSLEAITANMIDLSVYPNPVANELHIELNNINSMSTVSLFTLDGRMVYQGKTEDVMTINTSNLTNGIYLVRVQVGATVVNRKVTIAK